uniref:Transmembrane protein n=1 Tax=Cannabis sativa TaxID=3483 RepID=A0A803R7W2_CANSA
MSDQIKHLPLLLLLFLIMLSLSLPSLAHDSDHDDDQLGLSSKPRHFVTYSINNHDHHQNHLQSSIRKRSGGGSGIVSTRPHGKSASPSGKQPLLDLPLYFCWTLLLGFVLL